MREGGCAVKTVDITTLRSVEEKLSILKQLYTTVHITLKYIQVIIIPISKG